MSFELKNLPYRTAKPRESGITMVMDKGLSVEEARHFMSVAHPYVDLVKLDLQWAQRLDCGHQLGPCRIGEHVVVGTRPG